MMMILEVHLFLYILISILAIQIHFSEGKKSPILKSPASFVRGIIKLSGGSSLVSPAPLDLVQGESTFVADGDNTDDASSFGNYPESYRDENIVQTERRTSDADPINLYRPISKHQQVMQFETGYVLRNRNQLENSDEYYDVVTKSKELETGGAFRFRILGQRIATVYMYFLTTKPLITKCLTAAIIGGLGDLSAQYTEHRMSVVSESVYSSFKLDFMRQIGILIEAGFVSGPIMHYAFDLMEIWFPVHGDNDGSHGCIEKSDKAKKWCAAFIHLLLDTVFLCPIFVLSMMLITSLVEGRIYSLPYELRYEFMGTFYTSTLASIVFLPMQLLAFRLLPINLRLLYMNAQDIFWNAIVSFMAHRSRH
jgi:hypothetical protein